MGNKASRHQKAEDPNAAAVPKTDANANAAQPAPSSKEDANAKPVTDNRASRRNISSAQDQQQLIAAHKRAERNLNQRRAMRELSAAPIDRVTMRRITQGDRLSRTHGTRKSPEESAEVCHAYAEKMKNNSPFHKRWTVMDTLNEGSFGVVFTVQDLKTKTMGVIKVVRQLGNNKLGDWEAHVLGSMFKRNPNASVVRLLDKGMLAQDGGTNFMVMERIECNIKEWLYEKPQEERKVAACKVALEMLKGIYDLHMEGFIHRDLKPANMGILSAQNPVLLIYDLGMAKMYTDSEGKVRPIRTVCYMRGTPEWASPRAMKGREQTRFDDLIAWLFVIIELFHQNKSTEQALPWSNRLTRNAVRYLRSEHFPARLLIRSQFVPSQFYSIHTYLRTANQYKAPNYEFIAELVSEARDECNAGPSREHVNSVRVIDKGSNDAPVNPRKCSRNRIATKTANRK